MLRLNRTLIAVFAVAVAGLVGAVIVGFLAWSDSSGDGAAMRNRAAQVMPFDLSRTEHSFTKTASGGVQVVEVKDPADTQNIALIHTHLQDEAVAFRKGSFRDPAKIHTALHQWFDRQSLDHSQPGMGG